MNIILNFNYKNFDDKFKNHFKLINNDNEYLNEISELINNVIIIFINVNNKKKDFLDELIKNCLNSNFLKSKIFLLTLKENYNFCIEVYLNEKKHENKLKIFNFIEKTIEKITKEIKFIQNLIKNSIKIDKIKEEQLKSKKKLLKSFENKILSVFYKLAEISLDNIILLSNKFFPNEDEKIINCLEKIPQIQLKYISIKLKQLLNENNNKNNNKIWNIIFLYVKLLIKTEKKNEIKFFLEENLNYFKDDEKKIENLLEICLKFYDVESLIFLYKIKGENKNAIEIILTEIKTNYNNIIKNIFKSVFNIHLNNIFIQNIKNLVEIGIKICQNENEDFFWLKILNELYLILNDSKNLLEKENNINLDNFIDSYVFIIQNYLKNMCFYVSIKNILETVTNKNNVAEFKEFKNLLLDMLFLFKKLGTVLNYVKIMFNNQIIFKEKKFVEENENGIFINKNKCDFCMKEFEKNQKIFVFKCKHFFHEFCVNNECLICKNKEKKLFEENEINNNNKINNEINNNEINNKINNEINDFDSDEEIETEEMKEIRIKKEKQREINLRKIKIFDKKFYKDEI